MAHFTKPAAGSWTQHFGLDTAPVSYEDSISPSHYELERDAIFRLASVTKPIVATAALKMMEAGLLQLDDPVTKYLPWFTPPSPHGVVRPITIRQLLAHTSGLSYETTPKDVAPGMLRVV